MKSILLLLSLVALAYSACTDVPCVAFTNGTQHCDCSYYPEVENPAKSTLQDYWDHYFINMSHAIGVAGNPAFPFGAVIVDSRNNSVICSSSNVANGYFYQHAEVATILNCTTGALAYAGDANPNWPYMTLYTNVESCAMCMGMAIYRKIGRLVYGASVFALTQQRCWSQIWVSDKEVRDHAVDGGKAYMDVRGPLSDLEPTILSAFTSRC